MSLSEKERQERYERNQARVGLASNVLGLTAGTAALGTALRDPRLKNKNAGKTANTIYALGEKIPAPISRKIDEMRKDPKKRRKAGKIAGGMALGAVGLQAANTAGDVVANRVLSRESKVEKRLYTSHMGLHSSGGSSGSRMTNEEISKVNPLRSVQMVNAASRAGEQTTEQAVMARRTARRLAEKKALLARTTPTERDVAARTGNRQLRARAHQLDRQKQARLATPPSNKAEGFAPGNTGESGYRSWTQNKWARRGAVAGGGGLLGYGVAKADSKRERNQGIAIGAGTVGAGLLADQARREIVRDDFKYDSGGKERKIKVLRMKQYPAKKGKYYAGKKAALLGAGALASGGAAAAVHHRSKQPGNKEWQ